VQLVHKGMTKLGAIEESPSLEAPGFEAVLLEIRWSDTLLA